MPSFNYQAKCVYEIHLIARNSTIRIVTIQKFITTPMLAAKPNFFTQATNQPFFWLSHKMKNYTKF